ncbi:urease accessory protein UreD [Paenibacillus endoradicis]|uniref:urease accessory protein UreD n=1 Tax=Paenibacillus endoradicis TaxID=2972487 RepID=UPI0021599CE6|nr:urease accessory protein UreD [Paenibacillus endoradicis]MCR8657608.1 urease accessory protein UreD [Paenibacillus endoradicis]
MERYHESPLKITKTFGEPETNGLKLYMMDVSPGLMDGDHYKVTIDLEEHSHLIVTNQSFSKVHPAIGDGAKTDYQFNIGENAIFEYMPEPTIPYKESILRACTTFHLATGASLLYCDITTPGRTHRDEIFQYKHFSATTEVNHNGRRIAYDHYQLIPAIHRHQDVGVLEHYTHQAVFWIFSPQANGSLLQLLRQLFPSFAESRILAGASLASEQGIIVRMLGLSVWELQQSCDQIWNVCRDKLWNYPPCQLRK